MKLSLPAGVSLRPPGGSGRPGLPRSTDRNRAPDYGPSTARTRAGASRWVAADIAARRRKPRISMVSRASGGLNVYDGRTSQLIGTADSEDGAVHRVKPRSLGVRGQR